MPIEIYITDLKDEKMQEVLDGLGIEKPGDLNLDVVPIAICHTLEDAKELIDKVD